ncbi:MAG: signal peptidase I [Patescibacteria group bacterium]|nr:signal peptidase I [Patescibacteria group bacterium]MDE2015376.1 signal peptidase I [Patescibacteria group bacterium]MDE2227009.1 signal peptidase I [Patescibacteria group bacterium]
MRQFFASFLEVIEIALVAIGAVFLIRSFLIQPFLVSGSSMAPNFENGDYLLIDELTYHFRAPQRGEVIVFRYPNDTSTYFIKRVIGLPGERIEIKNDSITVFSDTDPKGLVLDENYLPKSTVTSGDEIIQLKQGEYLMLGDNRAYSFDSRSWGPLPAKDIIGIVRLRLWPPAGVTAFAAPQY